MPSSNSSPGMQTVTQKMELPSWVTDAAIKNLQQAYNVSQAMPGPYEGPRYAGMTDGMKANIGGLQQSVGQTQPAFNLAQSTAAGLMNYQPSNVQAGSYNAAQINATPQMEGSYIGSAPKMGASYVNGAPQVESQNISSLPMVQASMIGNAPQMQGAGMIGALPQIKADQISPAYLAEANLQKYMNPFTQNVIDNSLKTLEAQRLQSLNGIGDQAIRSRAFGGSRQGILEGVTNATSAMNAGNLAANLQAQNFAQAQQAAMGDITRNLAAQQANQSANLQAGTTNLQSGLQAALANQAVQQNTGQANMQSALQTALANQQAGMNAGTSNLQAALQASMANQNAGLTAQRSNQDTFLRGALANQAADMTANTNNMNAAMQTALANQQAGMTAESTNLAALMQSGLANQNALNSAAQFNVGNDMQAQLANQTAGLQGAGMNLNAANQLGALAGQGQAAYLDSLRAAMAGQGMYQQDQQALFDAQQAAYRENQNFPLSQLQIPLQALGMTPYGNTTTTTGPAAPQQSSNGFLQGLGAVGSLVGMGGTMFGAGGIWPGALGGLLGGK